MAVTLPPGVGSFTSITAGAAYACGIGGSSAYCWGEGSNAQLGNGNIVDVDVPGAVSNP